MGAKKLKAVGDFDRDEIHELAMDAIEHDPSRFQTRAEIDMEVVGAWVKAVRKDGVPIKAWPPVLVDQLPDGRLILADGFHRWELHRKLGRKSIRAVVVKGEDEGDVLLKGIRANMDNLKFRAVTEADRKHAVAMMIRSEKYWDWNKKDLAQTCGVSEEAVTQVRNRLHDQEGIALPERVKVFNRDGTWSGRWQRYRNRLGSGERPKITVKTRYGRCVVSLDGKSVDLGRDLTQAEAQLTEILEDRRNTQVSLASDDFVRWLNRRGVYAKGIVPSGCGSGGVLVHGAILFPVAQMDYGNIVQALGKALIYRKSGGDVNRLILVGYAESRNLQIKSLLPRDPIPIEFLTPEQVISSFGPQGPASEEPS